MPGVTLKEKCPKCGKIVKKDLSVDDYLSYPIANEPMDVDFYCYDSEKDIRCECEFSAKYILKVEIEKVK